MSAKSTSLRIEGDGSRQQIGLVSDVEAVAGARAGGVERGERDLAWSGAGRERSGQVPRHVVEGEEEQLDGQRGLERRSDRDHEPRPLYQPPARAGRSITLRARGRY